MICCYQVVIWLIRKEKSLNHMCISCEGDKGKTGTVGNVVGQHSGPGSWAQDNRTQNNWAQVLDSVGNMVIGNIGNRGPAQQQSPQPSQGTRSLNERPGKGLTKDHVIEIYEEWKTSKGFSLKKSLVRFLFAAISAYLFATQSLLSVRYLQKDDTSDEQHVVRQNFTNSILSDKILGISTLVIQFLPGIQLYTFTSTNCKLIRFLVSLFFPFFLVFFKVRKFSKSMKM